jgi:hypothetical protein
MNLDLQNRGPLGAWRGKQVDPPASGGDNGDMEHRVTALETRLDTVLPTLATKADISDTKGEMIKWVAGIGIASVTVIITVMGFLFSRLDNVKSTPPSPPVVIQVPSSPAPPSPVAKEPPPPPAEPSK